MANADGSIVIDTRLDNSGFQSGSNKMRSAINGLQSTVDEFGRQTQQSVSSIAPALQNAASSAKEFSSSLSESQFQKSTSQMESACESLNQKILALKQRAEQGFSSEAQAQKWQSDYAKVQQEAEKLQTKIQELGSQTIKADSLAEMEKEAEQLEQKLFNLYEKRDTMQDLGADKASKAWQNLELQIQKTEEALDRVERGIAAKSDPGSIESEIGGAGYTQAEATNGFQQLNANMNETMNALNGLSQTTGTYQAATDAAESSASSFGSVILSIGSSALSGAKGMLTGLTSVMQSLARAAITASSAVAKIPFKTMSAGANLAKRALSAFQKKSSQTTNATQALIKGLTGVKRMLITRVKRMFISAIFRGVQASLQNLAKYSDAFNQSMSNIKNSAKGMGGNLAVTFGNLVNALAPAITTIINWLSTAISYLNSFFALLQGKSTVTVAKKSTDDYAKSLKSASGAAKDLNHQLYGFDEITRQESDSGGGGGSNNGASYEEQDIGSLLPESIQNLFNSIKEAIAAQEWEKVGSLIADGLNLVVAKVDDWILNTLRPAGVKWAGIIARILNGLVDEFDFAALGKLLADGLNTIMEIQYTFFTTFNWSRLGEQLANGFNGLINNVDWVLLGNLWAAKVNALFRTTASLVSNMDWDGWGAKLHTCVKTFINGVDWGALETTVTEGINGLITLFDTFATGDWLDDLTGKLGTAVGGILDGINWSKLVFDILLGGVRLWGAFWKIVSMIDFPGIAKKIVEGINSFFAPGSDGQSALVTAASDAGAGIQGIIDAFAKLTDPNEGINFGNIRSAITSSIRTFMSQIDFAQLIESTGEMIHQLALTVLGLVDEIFSPDENGETIGQKLANGLNRIFLNDQGAVDVEKFAGLGKSFSDAIKSIFKSINDFFEKTDWDAIGQSIGEALANIDWLGIAESIVRFLWNALKAAVAAAGGLLGALIKRIFGLEITESMDASGKLWAETLFGSYSQHVAEAERSAEQRTLQAAALLGSGTAQAMVSSIEDGSSEVYWATSECFYGILNAIENEDGSKLYEAFAKLGKTPPQGFIDAVNEGLLDPAQMELLRQNGGEIFRQVVDATTADEVLAIFRQYGIELPEELASGMVAAQAPVTEAGHDLLFKLQEAAKTGDVEMAKQAFKDAGIEVTDSFAETIISVGLDNMLAALALMGMGVDQGTIEAMDMSHLSENLHAYMEASGKDLKTIATELGGEVGDGIGFTIPDAIAKALGIGTKEVQRVKGEMVSEASASAADVKGATESGEALGTGSAGGVAGKIEGETPGIGEATQGVVDAVTDTLDEGQEEAETASQNVADSVEDPLAGLPENVKPYAETLMQAVTQAIIDGNPIAVEAIEAAAGAIVDKAAEILSNGKGAEITKAFIDGWNNGIIYNYSPVVTNIEEVGSQILSGIQDYVNESNGQTIGENMLIGMINGFNNYGQLLVDTMAHICSVCVDDARRILGIASPSKVFEEIGGYVMEGMQIGMEDTGKDAISTVGDIAQSIINEAESGNGIHIAVDAVGDSLGVAEDRLTRIADIFIGIADSIAEMGGLTVPAIAAGQFLPYGAQAAGSAVSGPENGIPDLEDALYNAISRAQGNDAEGEPMIIKLVVDGREMADVVTRYQRQQARAWR